MASFLATICFSSYKLVPEKLRPEVPVFYCYFYGNFAQVVTVEMVRHDFSVLFLLLPRVWVVHFFTIS